MLKTDKMRVMVVDDDVELLKNMGWVLNRLGCEAEIFEDPREALNAYAGSEFDLVLADLSMPEMNGLEVLRRIRRINPQARVVLITGCPGGAWETLAEHRGVFRIIRKPMNLSDLNSLLADTGSRGEDETVVGRARQNAEPSGGHCETGPGRPG